MEPDSDTPQSPNAPPPDPALASALRSLAAIALHHGISTSEEQIRRGHLPVSGDSPDPKDAITTAAASLGLKARLVTADWKKLTALRETFPAIARLENGNFVIVMGIREGQAESQTEPEPGLEVAIVDPLSQPPGALFFLPQADFEEAWAGELVLLKRVYSLLDEKQPFNLRWFVPEIFKQRRFMRKWCRH